MKTKLIFNLSLLLFISGVAMAQAEWNWPEDRATAEEKNVLYTDAMKSGNFKASVIPLRWLLKNAPDLNSSIYINGAEIYEGLAELADDPDLALQYKDSALLMYDLRIKHFDDQVNVLNRKAIAAYKFYVKESDRTKELFNVYKSIYDLGPEKIATYNIKPMMHSVHLYKRKLDEISDEEVLKIYDDLNALVMQKIKEEEKQKDYQGSLDKLLQATIEIDCDFVRKNFGPKFKADPSDMEMAKKIWSLMMAGQCTDDPLYLKAVTAIFEEDPTYGMGYLIGVKYIGKEQYDSALMFLEKTLDLTEENTKKGDVHLKMASIYKNKGQKSNARNHYLKAAEQDPTLNPEAFTAVGDLYFYSFDQCAKEESQVEDRAVFIAAYEMYRKAGNQGKMAAAQQQFPAKESIFFENYEIGAPITVGCWINETVSMKSRD